jgi:hypothetical protein
VKACWVVLLRIDGTVFVLLVLIVGFGNRWVIHLHAGIKHPKELLNHFGKDTSAVLICLFTRLLNWKVQRKSNLHKMHLCDFLIVNPFRFQAQTTHNTHFIQILGALLNR